MAKPILGPNKKLHDILRLKPINHETEYRVKVHLKER